MPQANDAQKEEPDLRAGQPGDEKNGNEAGQQETQHAPDDTAPAIEVDETSPTDQHATMKVADSQAAAVGPQTRDDPDTPMAETCEEAKDIRQNATMLTEPKQVEVPDDAQSRPEEQDEHPPMGDAEEKPKHRLKEKESTPVLLVDEKMDQLGESPRSASEESRKRKRRSVTPPPGAEEIVKKAKAMDGEAIVTKRMSRSGSPQAPQKADTERRDPAQEDGRGGGIENATPTEGPSAPKGVQELADKEPSPFMEHTIPGDKDETVEPAIHPATRSLYLRNFKRPLNIQTLKNHLVTLAQGSSSVAPNQDPIKFFNINNIRSHAFVTFTSVSAAARVRAKMHHTRFPDEPQRDPLFVDFVPEEKIEGWVDQETSGSRGSRNSGSKLEVVYNSTDDGVEALFQEIDPFSKPQQPSTMSSRSSFSQRQASFTIDPAKTAVIASGIHPDRAGVVPPSPVDRRRSFKPPPSQRPSQDQGIGFKGLDELFESTSTKPKLYYKLPARTIIDDRLSMIRHLLPARGQSGDPGMKRYTFEKDGGKEDWADNGPEFGHGKKGQERLAGGGRGRAGFRPRGGGRGYFGGGDSYRGGGRR